METLLLEILAYHIDKIHNALNTDTTAMENQILLAYYARVQHWNSYWSTIEDKQITDYPLAATEMRVRLCVHHRVPGTTERSVSYGALARISR